LKNENCKVQIVWDLELEICDFIQEGFLENDQAG
jgi:hypothetical protein